MPFLPAATARALLAGFRALGMDADAIREAAAVAEADLQPGGDLLPPEAFARIWQEAFKRAPREELPTEVGLAVPFGAFGALDYLAASSPNVESAFHALASHFRYVAAHFALELHASPDGGEVRLVHTRRETGGSAAREVSDEFTLAVLAGRFSAAAAPRFAPSEFRLTRHSPAGPTRHASLLRAPVVFGCACAALRMPAASWKARLSSADPAQQQTLRGLAEQLELGAASADLELAVRARLRTLLPEGRGEAAALAQSLGMSERRLHRRLREVGRTFQQVLDGFRESEAERLLSPGRLSMAEVALLLGFSEQSAWNHAFERWKGMTPAEWAASRQGR